MEQLIRYHEKYCQGYKKTNSPLCYDYKRLKGII